VRRRLERRNGLPAPDDREALAPMLDRVEQVREVAGSFGRADVGHAIR
jgi:hypothetical protein